MNVTSSVKMGEGPPGVSVRGLSKLSLRLLSSPPVPRSSRAFLS